MIPLTYINNVITITLKYNSHMHFKECEKKISLFTHIFTISVVLPLFCSFNFPFNISLQCEELLLDFILEQVLRQRTLSIFLYLKVSSFHLHS